MCTACEKRLDVDFDDQQQRVVVKSISQTNENVGVRLTLSRPVYGSFYVRNDEDYFPKVDNATVTMTVDGGTPLTASRTVNVYTFAHQAQPGEELVLKVMVPGYDAITATAKVPQMPLLSEVEMDLPDYIGGWVSLSNLNVCFTLTDNGQTEDFYQVALHQYDTVYSTFYDTSGTVIARDTTVDDNYIFFSCTDYLLIDNMSLDGVIDPEDPEASSRYSGKSMLFTDAGINGQQHKVTLTIGSYYDYDYDWSNSDIDYSAVDSVDRVNHCSVVLEVSGLSRDVYLYRQTVAAYEDDEFISMFSEPVQIHNNIKDGIGIFGVDAISEVKFLIR